MMNVKLLLQPILVLFVVFASNNAFALDFHAIERSLNIQNDCDGESCKLNLDILLDALVHEHKKNKIIQSSKLNDTKEEIEQSKNNPLIKMNQAKLVVLNKITTKSEYAILKLGEVKFFGNLSIELHKCIKDIDPFNQNNLILLTIFDHKVDDDKLFVFRGWLLSSNHSISTLEHPVYEVLAVDCMTDK